MIKQKSTLIVKRVMTKLNRTFDVKCVMNKQNSTLKMVVVVVVVCVGGVCGGGRRVYDMKTEAGMEC